jgi:response regulator NasT
VAAPFTQERLLPALELAAARTTDLAALRADVVEIQNRLDTRKVVERAKGLLMAQQQLTEQEAFRLIQRTAMDRRTSMRGVAAAINNSLAGAA